MSGKYARRIHYAIDREIFLRVITLNLMIIWPPYLYFQQSTSNPVSLL